LRRGQDQPHGGRRAHGGRHALDQLVDRLDQAQLVLGAARAVAQMGVEPLGREGGEVVVEAVADEPLGPLAPAAPGQRVPRAAQLLARACERGAHAVAVQAQLARRLGAVHTGQVDERQGPHRLFVEAR
jgi:hypothetical protein